LPGSKDYSPQAAFMKFLMERCARLVVEPFWALPALARRHGKTAETGSNRTTSPTMGQTPRPVERRLQPAAALPDSCRGFCVFLL